MPLSDRVPSANIALEICGTERYPVIDVGTGITHAFICFSIRLNSGIKEECFGFYAKDGSPRKIYLSNNGFISKINDLAWLEQPTEFNFTQDKVSTSEIILFDRSRDLRWRLPLGGGVSQTKIGSDVWRNYLTVTDVDYDKGTDVFIGGPGMLVSEFQKNPTRFSNVKITFRKDISEAQRRSIFVEMNDWNKRSYKLTQDNCIDFVDSVAKYLNLKRPQRTISQSPVAYVSGLVKLNPTHEAQSDD